MAIEKKITPLGPFGLKPADTVRNSHHVTVPAGTTPDEIARPEFWVHVAAKMRIGDKIEVLADDATWYAELRVMEVGQDGYHGARVAFTLKPVALENTNAIAPLEDFKVQSGPNGTWQVIRSATKEVVKRDLPTQISGDKWIASHRKAMAA